MKSLSLLLLVLIYQIIHCVTGSPIRRDVRWKRYIGQGTYYEVGNGSCGESDTDDDLVVAVNEVQMHNGANPNRNPLCYQMVSIMGAYGNILAKVVDTCPGCQPNSLDLSPTVFQRVCGPLSIGVCPISWNYI